MSRTLRIVLIGGAALLLLAALSASDESSYDDGGYSQDGYSADGGYSQGGYEPDGGGFFGGLFGGGASGGASGTPASDAGDASMDAYRERDAASDENQRRFINQINETTDVYDAESGTTTTGLDNSADTYWTNPTTGDAIGTDAYSDNPDPSSYNATTNLDDM